MPATPVYAHPTRLTLFIAAGLLACDGHAPAASKGTAGPARPTEPARAAHLADDGLADARPVEVPLQLMATRRGPIGLHRLSDGEVALSGGLQLARASVSGDLVAESGWLAGLEPADSGAAGRVRALGGAGDDLWLTATRDGAEPAFTVHRWRDERWVAHEPEAPGSYYADYSTWPEGHALALRVGADSAALVLLDDGGARPARPRIEAAGLAATARPTKIAALTSGELFAAIGADMETGQISGVLRWGPEDTAAIFAPLPSLESRAPKQVTALAESGGHDVLIGGGVEIDEETVPYVARFDGTAWRLLDPPLARGSVVALAEGAGPTIWAVIDEDGPKDSLWRLHAPSDWDMWERVEFAPLQLAEQGELRWFWDQATEGWASEAPASAYLPSPAALGLDAAGELWVSARLLLADGSASPWWAALRTGAAAAPLALPDDGQVEAAQRDLLPHRKPRAGDPSCSRVYVQLYTATEHGPEVGTPELRAALSGPLAGLLLGEVRSRGERQVGLLLSASDHEAHKTAIAALASKLRYKPRPRCDHPPLLRGWRAGS